MKTFIRILVLLVAVILIFTAGFWLGSKGKSSSPEATDSETLQAKAEAQQKGLASKLSGGEKPEEPGGKAGEAPKPEGEPKTEGTPEKADASPQEAPSQAAGKPEAASAAAPKEDIQTTAKSETAAAPPPQTAPEETVPPSDTANSPTPKAEPETPAAEPRGMTLAEAAADGKKPEGDAPPPTKVTSDDLGANHLTYSIQAGAFLDLDLAQERLDELKAAQYPAYLVSAWDDKKQLWHTVRVGRYLDITQARVAARELSRKQRISAFVYGIGSLRYDELQEEPGKAPEPTTVAAKEKEQTQKAELP